MREIKFKAKRIDNDNWVYGDVIHDIAEHNMPRICIDREYSTGTTFVANAPRVNYKTIGQYTGLTDKNGKEIYEGDILRFSHPAFGKDYIGVVKWDENEVGFWCSINCYEMDNGLAYGGDFVEIIGNLWDTPELLKGDKE